MGEGWRSAFPTRGLRPGGNLFLSFLVPIAPGEDAVSGGHCWEDAVLGGQGIWFVFCSSVTL